MFGRHVQEHAPEPIFCNGRQEVRDNGKLRATKRRGDRVASERPGDYVASGGVPQPDGTQKAVELRIFPESMRGNGDGHRPGWPAPPTAP